MPNILWNTKIYILVVITVWAFYTPYENPNRMELVGSPQEASVRVWELAVDDTLIMNKTVHNYHLLEIEMKTFKCKEIPIPKLRFDMGVIGDSLPIQIRNSK